MNHSLDDILSYEKAQPIPQIEGLQERVWRDIGRQAPANQERGAFWWRKAATITCALGLGLAVGVGAAATAVASVRPERDVFAFGSRMDYAPSSLLEVVG